MSFSAFKSFILVLACCARSDSAPNIVILLVDDLGFNDVGFHGSPEILTPTINSLAQRGTILTRHYAMPVCTPSRAALMTGRYPANIGMQAVILRPDSSSGLPLNIPLMPSHLRNLGYATHALGKWHLGYSSRDLLPTYRGFDTFFGSYNSGVDHFTHTRDFFSMRGVDFHDDVGMVLNHTSAYAGRHSTDILTDRASDIILQHHFSLSPLFIYLAFQVVHAPFEAKQDDLKYFMDMHDEHRLNYVAAIKNMDDGIKKVVESLEARNVLDNTIIVFSSDNGGTVGPGSNYPLRAGKSWLFEGGVRVPAFVMGPGIPSHRLFHSYFHLSDWLPTLYAAAGGDVTQLGPLDGINQWHALVNDDSETGPRSEMLLNILPVEKALIDGDFKLYAIWGPDGQGHSYGDGWSFYQGPGNEDDKNRIEWIGDWRLPLVYCNSSQTREATDCSFTHGYTECLFNIKTDPCEYNNVIDQYPEVVMRMREKLERYERESLPCITNTPDPQSNPSNFHGFWIPWIFK